jgi:hypothetical protein
MEMARKFFSTGLPLQSGAEFCRSYQPAEQAVAANSIAFEKAI